MTETFKALRSKQDEGHDAFQAAHIASRQWVNRWCVPGLLCAGLAFGLASHAGADPIADQIYSNCTFTIADLDGLVIPDRDSGLLSGGELQASYIIIYVRENPNDGQEIFELVGETLEPTNTFTGPILCTNSATDVATPTTENTLIAPSGTVNILGAEEASHLQYEPASGDPEKRVCHTVAGNTDCFLIKPNP
jgi:hypothetical protein